MSEWCYGIDAANNVVLKEQDHYDSLPSPDTWMHWETSAGGGGGGGGGVGGNFGWANNFDFGAIENAKPQRRTLFNGGGNQEMSQFDVEQSFNSDDFGLSSGESRSFLQNAPAGVRPEYYVNDDLMSGTDPTDDIFLSSLFQDDVLPLQSLYIAMPSDSDSTNRMMDMQSNSSDTDGVGNLKCFANPFSGSHASNNTSNQSRCPSEKVLEIRDDGPSDHKIARKTTEVNNLSSIEESVLTGLETVLNQLNDETRLCFRDSMYRLARHSEEQTSKNTLVEGQSSDELSLPETSDVCSRSRAMETAESETNAVDRCVAYMMFNKVDGNQQDQLSASPTEYVHSDAEFAANGACGFNEGLAFSPSDSLVQCEVPVLSRQAQS